MNAVAPGSVRTSMTKGLEFPADADFDLVGRIMSPIGPGDPASVAAVVALLASDDGAHISGEIIRIDGAPTREGCADRARSRRSSSLAAPRRDHAVPAGSPRLRLGS